MDAGFPQEHTEQPEPGDRQDRLDSWKEIAKYVNRQVRTVQLWEKSEGLPVHRHLHNRMGTIYAYKSEIEVWWTERSCLSDGSQLDEKGAQRGLRGARKIMLAVLPFTNMSGEPEQEYFNDGLTEETITELGRLNPQQLGVIGRTSAMHYKDVVRRIDDVGRELGVDYILEGSVRRSASRLRICVQLIQVKDQCTLWSETYDRELEDVFAVQSDVAKRITHSLSLELLPRSESDPLKIPHKNLAAHEAYLKGRYFWNRRTEQSVRKAILHFDRAVEEDPEYALAYSGLADCYCALSFYEVLAPKDGIPKARAAALKALELNANLGEAHASLGDVYMHFDWQWANAEKEYQLAVQLSPNYALGYKWYANFLGLMGRNKEARALITQAETLDPLSLVVNVWSGVIYHYDRQYQNATEEYARALELDPNFVWAHAYLGLAYEQLALIDEAIEEFQKAIALSEGNTCIHAMLAHAYATSGKPAAALEILDNLQSSARENYLPSYDIAIAYSALADRVRAMEWLYRAYEERNLRIVGLQREPRVDCLRSERGFQELVRRVGLA
jgi:TolB-like protein/tetratricopeptide (TPR) repeat protein